MYVEYSIKYSVQVGGLPSLSKGAGVVAWVGVREEQIVYFVGHLLG